MPMILELDDYERDNLKWALECIRLGYVGGKVSLNSGDWVGQISWKLGAHPGRPNIPIEVAKKQAGK